MRDVNVVPASLSPPLHCPVRGAGDGIRVSTSADDYAAFVRARGHALLRSAYLLTGDQHLAEDLVQEALARTHQAWSRLRDSGNVEAYARRTMYHLQVSIWRRRRWVREELPGEVPEPVDSGGDEAESAALRMTIERALRSLSPRQRAVVVLRYFDGCTDDEAAQILGVSVSTVKTQLGRALDHLRRLVPELDGASTAEGAGR